MPIPYQGSHIPCQEVITQANPTLDTTDSPLAATQNQGSIKFRSWEHHVQTGETNGPIMHLNTSVSGICAPQPPFQHKPRVGHYGEGRRQAEPDGFPHHYGKSLLTVHVL